MRCLNESLARQANAEDNCTGRFREERYKSQALLDEQVLLTCMSYVDLNPMRVDINPTPETSGYASTQARVQAYQPLNQTQPQTPHTTVKLVEFIGNNSMVLTLIFLQRTFTLLIHAHTGRTQKAQANAENMPLSYALGQQ